MLTDHILCFIGQDFYKNLKEIPQFAIFSHLTLTQLRRWGTLPWNFWQHSISLIVDRFYQVQAMAAYYLVTTPNQIELDADAHRLLSDASDEFTVMLLDVANSIALERKSTVIEKADLTGAADLLVEVFDQSSDATGPIHQARTAMAAALREFVKNAG